MKTHPELFIRIWRIVAEVKLRYNPDAEEVELVVDDEVALTSGADVFQSWVEDYNEKHPVPVEEPVREEEPVTEPVTPAQPVEEKEVVPEVDKTDET